MKTTNYPVPGTDFDYMSAEYDDILFRYKNKDYGAYVLRKAYDRNMVKACLIAIAFLVMMVYLPNIAKAFRGENLNDDLIFKEFELSDYKEVKEEKKPEPIPEPIKKPALKRATLAFVKPIVRQDDKAKEEIAPPDVEDLANVEIGTKTVVGTPDGVPDGLEEIIGNEPAPTGMEEHKPAKIEVPFTIVEQMPAFPDGEAAMFGFISKHIDYPDMAKNNGIEGTVYVSFVVEKDGSITNVQVRRDIGGGCGEEAVRVVKMMPNWLPGKQRGVPVRVQFNLPIKYKLG